MMTEANSNDTVADAGAKEHNGFDFEAALRELEELVASMEGGELSLEESLKSFEQGIRLTRDCQHALKKAEQKVQILLNDSGDTEDLEIPVQED